MPFLGTIVNFLAIFVLGIAGFFIKTGIPKRITDAIVSAMSVCVLYIGIDGAIAPAPELPDADDAFIISAGLVKILVMLISMGLGTVIGELIDIDKWVGRLGAWLEGKLSRGVAEGSFAKGFVSCTLLFCVGAMAVNGSIADATGESGILLSKSVIDGVMAFVMASSMGVGCAFSAFPVLIYQGLLTLGAVFLFNVIPTALITYMSVTGSLIIILIGTNMLGITKVKTANMIPAIFMPLAVAPLIYLIV